MTVQWRQVRAPLFYRRHLAPCSFVWTILTAYWTDFALASSHLQQRPLHLLQRLLQQRVQQSLLPRPRRLLLLVLLRQLRRQLQQQRHQAQHPRTLRVQPKRQQHHRTHLPAFSLN